MGDIAHSMECFVRRAYKYMEAELRVGTISGQDRVVRRLQTAAIGTKKERQMRDQNSKQTITTIRPDQRTRLSGPTDSPFVREAYVSDGHVWIGHVSTEPGSATPWHHHGAHETYAYLLSGEARVEFGPDGSQSRDLTADGSLHIVPAGLVHREINVGSDTNHFLIIRIGTGPAVVPVEMVNDSDTLQKM
jgi:uncharacterized RmlC-like cupin family protein